MPSRRPLLALTLGDPAGIGPEVALAAIADARVRAAARVLVLGPASLRPAAVELCAHDDPRALDELAWLDTGGPATWRVGEAQASCGRAAIAALRRGAELAQAGRVDALVTGPVSKRALHQAGEPVEGQTELLGRWAGAPHVQMMAVAGALRVLLLTRHMPLAAALAAITSERVLFHLHLLHDALVELGIDAPRLALAGLNPHASEGGLFGSEEAELLAPAVARARAAGLDVTGPEPPDTVFGRAARGAFDAVLALYHDQAFIPVKLLDPTGGLTVLVGLPYLRVSPAHGTAFDIAGKGLATAEPLVAALLQAAQWAGQRARARQARRA